MLKFKPSKEIIDSLDFHDCELLKEAIRFEIETTELKKRLNKIGFINETK